ncbi:MAG: hypothetical protein Q9163_003468 [Psora crenata]
MTSSDSLPHNFVEWNKEWNLFQSSTQGHLMHSGSEFTLYDFLRLRVIHRLGGRHHGSIDQLHRDHTHVFPQPLIDQARTALNHQDVLDLKKILPDKKAILEWKQKGFIPSGRLAIGLELLYLITTRTRASGGVAGESSAPKVLLSPPNTRSRGKNIQAPTSPLARLSIQEVEDPYTPIGQKSRDVPTYDETPAQETPGSPPNTEIRRIEYDHQRASFVSGDEQTVNACLISLLMGVSHYLRIMGRIHFDRTAFRILKPNGEPIYTARVDGILRAANGRIQGFMEVKPYIRGLSGEIRMQEAAQMAAFIYETTKGRGRTTGPMKSWMISMDANQAFITIATYNYHYIEFLREGIPLDAGLGKDDFMIMEEYGPYDLHSYFGGLIQFFRHACVLILSGN